MNRDIVKRGLLPHFRMGEVLNGFVNPISQVIDYLSSEDEESFIDLSQLLGARMIIGSDQMQSVIIEKILKPFIFDKKNYYINKMVAEIRSRQLSGEQCLDRCNIKETRGGLRDIEATSLLIKAFIKSAEPIKQNFFEEHKDIFPEISERLCSLDDSAEFLRTIRNLYRITEAAEDEIHKEYLTRLSEFLKNSSFENKLTDNIYNDIRTTLYNSATAIDDIIKHLETLSN